MMIPTRLALSLCLMVAILSPGLVFLSPGLASAEGKVRGAEYYRTQARTLKAASRRMINKGKRLADPKLVLQGSDLASYAAHYEVLAAKHSKGDEKVSPKKLNRLLRLARHSDAAYLLLKRTLPRESAAYRAQLEQEAAGVGAWVKEAKDYADGVLKSSASEKAQASPLERASALDLKLTAHIEELKGMRDQARRDTPESTADANTSPKSESAGAPEPRVKELRKAIKETHAQLMQEKSGALQEISGQLDSYVQRYELLRNGRLESATEREGAGSKAEALHHRGVATVYASKSLAARASFLAEDAIYYRRDGAARIAKWLTVEANNAHLESVGLRSEIVELGKQAREAGMKHGFKLVNQSHKDLRRELKEYEALMAQQAAEQFEAPEGGDVLDQPEPAAAQ